MYMQYINFLYGNLRNRFDVLHDAELKNTQLKISFINYNLSPFRYNKRYH